MKKTSFVFVLVFLVVISAVFQSCGAKNVNVDSSLPSENSESTAPHNNISKEMAYDGIYNYCHSVYDWSIEEENPDIMYLKMGEETESEYQVIFRSYTGAFVYFYVDKSSGITRLTEYVPALELEEAAGTIDLYDYLESDEK